MSLLFNLTQSDFYSHTGHHCWPFLAVDLKKFLSKYCACGNQSEFQFRKRLNLQWEQIPIRCLHSMQHLHSGVLPRNVWLRFPFLQLLERIPPVPKQDPFRSLATYLFVKAQAFSPHVASADTENIIIIASEKNPSNCVFSFSSLPFILVEEPCTVYKCLVRSGTADLHLQYRFSSFLAHCFHANYSGTFHV